MDNWALCPYPLPGESIWNCQSNPSPARRIAVSFELAYNLRWVWRSETRQLFRTIDPAKWDACGDHYR
ncbi:MAG: DUF3417 domain-containing protein [Lawsonella clevelandensis]